MSSDARPPADDVRMRGFGKLTPVQDVLDLILLRTEPCPREETLPIEVVCGRVLAHRVVSPINVPHFRRAAMDGFAVRAAEVPGTLSIVGEAKPGRPFAGEFRPRAAVRVMTGAPVPDHADAVVPVERCRIDETTVAVADSVPAGKHVASIGEDVSAGDEALEWRRVLRPQDVGLLSALGISEVSVYAKPLVKIVVTGAELLPPGSRPRGFHIADSNSVMLRAFVERDGGIMAAIVHTPDDPDRLRVEMLTGDWDLLLVSGGTSVGVDDHAPSVLKTLTSLFIHGLDMKPGMPTAYGIFPDGRMAFLLPGNPGACLFAYDLLARVALRRLAGQGTEWPYRTASVTMTKLVASKVGRVDYVRLKIDRPTRAAAPVIRPGAANLSGTVEADGFLIMEAEVERLEADVTAQAFLYDR